MKMVECSNLDEENLNDDKCKMEDENEKKKEDEEDSIDLAKSLFLLDYINDVKPNEMIKCDEDIEKDKKNEVFVHLNTNQIRYDNYEKGLDTIILHIYIKLIKQSTLQVTFAESWISVRFQTSEPKFSANESTIFLWNLNLKKTIKPEECSYNLTQYKLEIELRKSTPCKWDGIKMFSPQSKPYFSEQLSPTPGLCVNGNSSINNIDCPKTPTNVWLPATRSITDIIDDDFNLKPPSPPLLFEFSSSLPRFARKTARSMNIFNPSPSTPPKLGYTGLDNLGNTCFMNSVIQCLSNTEELRDYFISNNFKGDLNSDNVLGTGGKLAISFAVLLKHLWSGEHHSYSPSKLKSLLGDKVSQFSGFAQHDAHEYMAFLLDTLHEDVNRIRKKPYIQMNGDSDDESVSLSDEKLAEESWKKYKMRNDSVIVDKFYGQFKSKLVCPSCPKVSITFDSFLFLPLPMPKNQILHTVYLFHRDTSKKPVRHLVKLPYESKMASLFQILSSQTGIDVANFRAIVVSNGTIKSIITPSAHIPFVINNEMILVFETLSKEDKNEEIYELVVYQCLSEPHLSSRCSRCNRVPSENVKLKRCSNCHRSCYCDQECQKLDWFGHKRFCIYRPEPVGCPFIISTPKSQCTFSNLSQMLFDYSRHSVDVYHSKLKNSPSENNDIRDNDSGIYSDTAENPTSSLSSSSTSSSIASNNLIPKTRFSLRYHLNPFDANLNEAISIPEPKDPEDFDVPLNLSSKFYLSMEWKNNDKNFIVESKDLDHNFDILEAEKLHSSLNEHSLEECLQLFTEPEILSQKEAWYCPKCKEPREATKQLSLWRLPHILIIQLKRFSFKNLLYRDKIEKLIKFPINNLDLSKYCCPENENRNAKQKCLYDLFGVVNHYGGMFGGHYTAFARTTFEDKHLGWRVYDDNRVEDIDEENIVTKNAYILFYRLKK